MNAIAELWQSVESESLDRMVPFGQAHLERASFASTRPTTTPSVRTNVSASELTDGKPSTGDGRVVVHATLIGLLNSYHRAAA